MPKRIQRQRRAGWRLPADTICVTRGSRWGNPFRVGGYYMMGDPDGKTGPLALAWAQTTKEIAALDPRFIRIETRQQAVEWFERYARTFNASYFDPLRGYDLACWCKIGEPCHGDSLLRMANE